MARSKLVKFSHIPQELLIEILLRLPFQSILSFKLVSKQWKNLICDPMFLNRYRDKSLVLFVYKKILYLLSFNNTIQTHYPSFTVRRFPIKLDNASWDHRLLSDPLNGMACVQSRNGHLLFYNLFTCASYTIKDAPLLDTDDRFTRMCYGFGYDRHADDYKIVVVYDFERGKPLKSVDIKTVQNEDNDQFWVYSFKNHVWKPLVGFPYHEYNWDDGSPHQACSKNSVLHWFVLKGGENKNKAAVIVTYDLHTCRFGEISTPMVDGLHWPSVSELGGKLCCSWIHRISGRLCVWVMEEYGVVESWTMLFSIDSGRFSGSFPDQLAPMELFEDRDGRRVVLFVCSYTGFLSWYDIANDDMKVVAKSEYLEEEESEDSEEDSEEEED